MSLLPVEKLQLLYEKLDSLSNKKLLELLDCFPFKNMKNISILEIDLLRLHILFAIKICQKDVFSRYTDAIKYILDFALTNIWSLEGINADNILSSLLELVKVLLIKLKQIGSHLIIIEDEKERLFETISFTTKLKIFTTNYVADVTTIFCELLNLNMILPITVSRYTAEIVEKWKGFNAVGELASISNIVLKKFSISTEAFNASIPWLLLHGPTYLSLATPESIILDLISCMNDFYAKFRYIKTIRKYKKTELLDAFLHFLTILPSTGKFLLTSCNNPKLRNEALNLFAIALSESINEKLDTILDELQKLPYDPAEWPTIKSSLFYEIVGFVCKHNCSIWKAQDILDSLSSLVYSYNRFSMSTALLRNITYIYPIYLVENFSRANILLGNDLIIIMASRRYELDEIITCHIAQLIWLLRRSSMVFKQHVLSHWLKHSNDLMTLAKAVIHCKVHMLLLPILTDRKADKVIIERAIQLINNIRNQELSTAIATSIPLVHKNVDLLGRLLLSNPGVPSNMNATIKLCEYMSLILVFISNDKILSTACIYCKHLVIYLKRERNIVQLFCKNMRNIQFLLFKCNKVNDETTISILDLLKSLVLIQRRNHTHLDFTLQANLNRSLSGPEDKLNKCLELLRVIVISKNIFIVTDQKCIETIVLRLFDLCKRPEVAASCLNCLTEILKMNKWLVVKSTTNRFIELWCCLAVDNSWPEFLKFVSCWLKILRRWHPKELKHFPNKAILQAHIEYHRRFPNEEQQACNKLKHFEVQECFSKMVQKLITMLDHVNRDNKIKQIQIQG